jgi:hypothetical protein
MIRDLRDAYAGSWRYMLACPLLFAVPVAVEGVQHGIEYMLGMFEGLDAAQAVETHPARMAWAYLKATVLALSAYWVIRYLALGAAQAGRLEPKAVRLFAPVMLWHLAWGALLMFGGGLLTAAGIDGRAALWVGLGVFFGNFMLEAALSAWKVGAALGNERLTFTRSLKLIGPRLLPAVGFMLAAILPLMIAHYALGIGAVFAPAGLVIPMLVLDSILVGYLGTLVVAATFMVARRATARAGEELVPAGGGAAAGPASALVAASA